MSRDSEPVRGGRGGNDRPKKGKQELLTKPGISSCFWNEGLGSHSGIKHLGERGQSPTIPIISTLFLVMAFSTREPGIFGASRFRAAQGHKDSLGRVPRGWRGTDFHFTSGCPRLSPPHFQPSRLKLAEFMGEREGTISDTSAHLHVGLAAQWVLMRKPGAGSSPPSWGEGPLPSSSFPGHSDLSSLSSLGSQPPIPQSGQDSLKSGHPSLILDLLGRSGCHFHHPRIQLAWLVTQHWGWLIPCRMSTQHRAPSLGPASSFLVPGQP